ncbi:universal stress protein [Paenibacillus sp. TRM 82003]|nr:universal stress protein [Paenibacillus sp. TRM 82003]
MYNKILLATDGSEHSIRAAEQAAHIARCSKGSTVHIVYVVDQDAAKSDVLHHWNTDLGDKRREKIRPIERKLKDEEIPYEVKILHGEPGPTIVDYGNKHEFDLVVLGSRGLNALQELVLGSVSHKVAKRVNCPVLIVK